MTIPTVYKWNDTNAPVLNGTRGSLINLLRKCLVDGYGSKSPAGWSYNFPNGGNTTGYFKGSTALGCTGSSIYIDEATPAANLAYIQGYETVTGATTTIGPFLTVNTTSLQKSLTSDTTSRIWVLIADDKFFYLFSYPGCLSSLSAPPDFIGNVAADYSTQQLVVFGDMIKTSEESFNGVIGYTYSTGYHTFAGFMYQFLPGGSNGLVDMGCSRKIDGVLNATPVKMYTGHPGGGVGYGLDGYNTGAGRILGENYTGSRLILGRPPVIENTLYAARGYLPGFYIPCHDMDTITNFTTLTQDGRSFMLLKLCINNNPYKGKRICAIETGAAWS